MGLNGDTTQLARDERRQEISLMWSISIASWDRFIVCRDQRALQRYGFGVETSDDGFNISVPTHRMWDVPVFDIYEEIAKSLGTMLFHNLTED